MWRRPAWQRDEGSSRRSWPAAGNQSVQFLDRSPLPAGEETVDKEHNDGADYRTDQACAFSGPVPSECLAEISRHEGADDAQYGGENEA